MKMSVDDCGCEDSDCEYCNEAPWTCCSCQRSFCMMESPAHDFSVDYNCEEDGCIEPNYDPRVRGVVTAFKGKPCLCHPNAKRVLYGNSAGVHDCNCGSLHAICYDCMEDPVTVSMEEIRSAMEKNPTLSREQAFVQVYQDKYLVHKLRTLHIEPLND